MTTVTIGKKYDGTISVCKAKPEHRGKGSCKHFEHETLETDNINEYIKQTNEKVLIQTRNILGVVKKRNMSRNARKKLLNLDNLWNTRELKAAAAEAAEDYEEFPSYLIDDFYENFKQITAGKPKVEIAEEIEKFLRSDNETAVEIRKQLGEEIDLNSLSLMITKKPNGMLEQFWTSRGKVSVSRAIMTRIDYDMDDKNHISSVLYFKGRCCYCNRTLSYKNPETSPTGEHLTPISTPKPDIVRGSTRHGNMAICCNPCNAKRQDEDMVEWLSKTGTAKKEIKPYTLAKIEAFRKFTNYREYTTQENTLINEAIHTAAEFTEQFRNEKNSDKGFIKGSSSYVKPVIDKIVSELQTELDKLR